MPEGDEAMACCGDSSSGLLPTGFLFEDSFLDEDEAFNTGRVFGTPSVSLLFIVKARDSLVNNNETNTKKKTGNDLILLTVDTVWQEIDDSLCGSLRSGITNSVPNTRFLSL